MLSKIQLLRARITVIADSMGAPVVLPNWPKMAIEDEAGCANLLRKSEEGLDLSSKNKYPYLGKMYPGDTVAFESTSEPFAQYTLADGTTVKSKLILLDAVRLETFDENGNPVYQFQFQQILAIVPADSLKKKTQ